MNRRANTTIRRRNEREVPLTPESIDGYLEHLRSVGRTEGTLETYRQRLGQLYQALPEDSKSIRRDTLIWWREKLVEEGRSAAGINQYIIVINGYLGYMGARDFQVIDRLEGDDKPVPDLTRNEYLRLLSAARILGREQTYLLVKVFGNSDLPLQELPCLTVEAARAGMIHVVHRCSSEIIRFPNALCQELLDYARRQGIRSGPIFLTRTGNLIARNNVTAAIRQLCAAAQVPEEKGSPRCLRKMYQATREGIERNVALLVERAQDRLLEEEQLTVGWDR